MGPSSSLRIRFLYFITVLSLFLIGCDRRRVYEQYHEVKGPVWDSKDFFRYHFTIQDTAIPYNFYINIRNSTEYPYANLFLFVRTMLPGQMMAGDTLDLLMATPDGKWVGRGIGKYRDNQVLILKEFRFPAKGDYAFEIEHAMRDENLKGIAAVGIRVEKSRRK